MHHLNQAETLDSPVFIVGSLRSGSTLLRLLLAHHPKMNIFGEFEEAVSQISGDEWPAIADYHRFLASNRMFQAKHLKVNPSLSYEDLVYSFIEQLYARNPKPLIGASVHSRIDVLPSLWKNARYIHILRDPRDVARSCIGMGWVGNVYEGAEYWLRTERHWDVLCERTDKTQRLTVRYEDLLRDTEKSLTAVCHFLDMEYDPAMLELEADTTYSRPDPVFAEQWRKKLSPDEVQWVESKCADLMRKRGYEVSTTSPQPPSLWVRSQLKLQNRWYRVMFNINQWGFGNWFLFVLSKRLRMNGLKDKMQVRINRINTQHLK